MNATADGGTVAGLAATQRIEASPKKAAAAMQSMPKKEAVPKDTATVVGMVAAAPDPCKDSVADGGMCSVVVNIPLSPTQSFTTNPLRCLVAHRLVHHKTYRTEYDDHEFLHYAYHPPTASGLKGCAKSIRELCEAMAILDVKGWGLRIDAQGTIAALVGQQEVAESRALQSVVGALRAQEPFSKVGSGVPVPSLEESDDEGDVVPEKDMLWRTSKAPGTCVVLDRQKVERFICTVGDKAARCLLTLPPGEHDALWRHLSQFLRKYQVSLERIDVSHGNWMQSKSLHLKLTVADKTSYVQLHDTVSRTPFVDKQVSKRAGGA